MYVFVMTVPAVYVLMLGTLFKLMFGWDLMFSIILATIISTGYVLIGGFRSVVKTDWIQFGLMYFAFFIMLIVLINRFGSIDFLMSNTPESHFNWHGGQNPGYIFSWYFIAMAALVEPAFYQRCYAAKTPRIARKGIIIAIMFWMIFDFMTTSTGLYSRALLGEGINGVEAFPRLADKILPIGLKGLFFIGLMTTIQSTIDSYSFLAATTLGHDVFSRIKVIGSRFDETVLTRWGLLISGILAVSIALAAKSVVDIWHSLGSIGTPGLLLPLALSYNSKIRFRKKWALINLICNPILVGGWFYIRSINDIPIFPFSIQPIFPGLLLSVLLLAFDHLTRPTSIK